MITFRVTLLFGFNLNATDDRFIKTQKGKRKPQKRSSSKNSRSSSKKKQNKLKPAPLPVQDKNSRFVINVEKLTHYLHVQYELIPGKFQYWVDILCWGPVAKIYTSDGVKCVKTLVKENVAWVPVFLEHYVYKLDTEDILLLLNHVVSFKFTTTKSKLGATARAENCRSFYLKIQEEDKSEEFEEVYTENPNSINQEDRQHKLTEFVTEILLECVNNPYSSNEVVTWIHNRNKLHNYTVQQIVRNGKVECQNHYTSPVKDKNEQSKKNKKKKNQVIGSQVEVPAEIFFTDPDLATYKFNQTDSAIATAYVLVSTVNLLSVQQKFELNPFIMKFLKISNLPYEILRQHGFTSVYASCSIPELFKFESPVKPLSKTVKLTDSHLVITQELPKTRLIEILKTRNIIVELYAVKEILFQDYKDSKKRTKKKKSRKSSKERSIKDETKSNKGRNEAEVIATVSYDLSSLMNNIWIFKEKGQCHNPNVMLCQQRMDKKTEFVDRLTVNEINLIVDVQRMNKSPLTEQLLLTKGTTFKLECHFLAPQYSAFYTQPNAVIFKRLLLIIFNRGVAKALLNEILLHNQVIRGPDVLGPSLLFKQIRTIEFNLEMTGTDVLTGFTIDSGDRYIFFIEGVADGFILSLFHRIRDFNPCTAKIFFNSDYVFESRLYNLLIWIGGFYNICVKLPLQEIFAKQEIYVEGNAPFMCWRAVKKLNLLLNSSKLTNILHYDLLPTVSELISFGIEYGLQLRYRFKEQEEENSLKTRRSTF